MQRPRGGLLPTEQKQAAFNARADLATQQLAEAERTGRADLDEIEALRTRLNNARRDRDDHLARSSTEVEQLLTELADVMRRAPAAQKSDAELKAEDDERTRQALDTDIGAVRTDMVRSKAVLEDDPVLDHDTITTVNSTLERLKAIAALVETDPGQAALDLAALKSATAKIAPIVKAAQARAEARAVAAAKRRVEEMQRLRFVDDCVDRLRDGDPADVRSALSDLKNKHVLDELGETGRDDLLRKLISAVFDGAEADGTGPDRAQKTADALDAALARDPGVFADLLLEDARFRVAAGALTRFERAENPARWELPLFGRHAPAVAAAVVRDNWYAMDSAKVGIEVYQWINEKIDLATWNDPAGGLAARMFNNLWHFGRTDRICDLIALGVDSSLPASTGKDQGRAGREGIWSGFVQPLQHLLGNYVKRVAEATETVTDPDTGEVTTRIKDSAPDTVKAAATILADLGRRKQTPILTDYGAVVRSGMLTAFRQEPGTIWGFEDVRLPYVQAARETQYGQQPLRMMEIWNGVKGILDKDGYQQLFTNPDATIDKCVQAGARDIRKKIADNDSDYAGRDPVAFVKEFEAQCRDYLRFLAGQTPSAKQATAEINGKDLGKYMGGLACKAGLWWAQKQGKPVYYCLDGIRMNDATSYKAYKNKGINDYWAKVDLATQDGVDPAKIDKYLEVITFQEIREILKNWESDGIRPGLKDTVVFIEKGEILKGDELDRKVAAWQSDMAATDQGAPARRRGEPAKFADKLNRLDPELVNRLSRDEASEVVAKTELLKLAAQADPSLEVLDTYLRDQCDSLIDTYGILPKSIRWAFGIAASTSGGQQARLLQELHATLSTISDELRVPLEQAAKKRWPDYPG